MVESIKVSIEEVIANSNRGPDKMESEEDLRNPTPYPGGLTTALAPLLSQGNGGTWVSTTGSDFERTYFHDGNIERVPFNGGHINFTEAVVDGKTYEEFYEGFSRELWFLMHLTKPFHDLSHLAYPQPDIPQELLPSYRTVNQAHAARDIKLLEGKEGYAIVNSHDFHLMLLSRMLRQSVGESNIDPNKVLLFQFMHTPIPVVSPTLEYIVDQGHFVKDTARELFTGLTGNHAILVQEHEFADNLADIFKWLGLTVSDEGDHYYIVHHDMEHQRTHIAANPIGIDTERVRKTAMENNPEILNKYTVTASTGQEIPVHDLIKDYKGKGYQIMASVERLDPTKGLLPRLYMIERALEKVIEEDLKFIYVGFGPDSRGNVRSLALAKVTEINMRARQAWGHDIIYLKIEPMYFPHNIMLMKEADIYAATPLEDGMNLTVHEYVKAQSTKPERERGSLLLGNCGVQRIFYANQLGFYNGVSNLDIVDLEGSVTHFLRVLRERPKLDQRAIATVNSYDVHNWFDTNLKILGHATGKRIEVVY